MPEAKAALSSELGTLKAEQIPLSLESNLHGLYGGKFFSKFGIDRKSGRFAKRADLKFPTFPFLGSCYGSRKKVLFIGLDIGSDELCGAIQSFQERREAIEYKALAKHNPHIAGTYFSVLHFLREEASEWAEYWEGIDRSITCQKLLKLGEQLPASNPLSYVALTNYFKFVRPYRTDRSGGENRKYVDKAFEQQFFAEEVEAFDPQVVIFQGALFSNPPFREVLARISTGREVYIGLHPSARKKGIRQPRVLVRQIMEGRVS